MKGEGHELTRRRVLAGLATVGAAGAAAGLGTSAYLNDTESFTDNTVEAGALNLRVTVDNIEHANEIVRDNTTITPKDTADGNEVTITVDDMKPGDWLILEWNPEVVANPGYVQVTSDDDDYVNEEGENPEPETDTSSPGDLGDALLSTVWSSYESLGGGDPRQYLEGLDETTDNNDSDLGSYETPDEDGETSSGAHYTTMNEAHDVYKSGVLLRDPSTGDPLEVGTQGDAAWFYQLLELPPSVGNEIQGDSLTFTMRFDAEQVRHNDAPFANS
ncbi:SipW-dependent-type signal peptide-containing protein [Halobacterium yunchengense]|uniref:SipW-dependent-type signal peptide-containing protein n=1 Tax=Halobacterium yunchengense TaxID=3108497 RepID=UPI00300A13CB